MTGKTAFLLWENYGSFSIWLGPTELQWMTFALFFNNFYLFIIFRPFFIHPFIFVFFYWKNISFMSEKASVASASVCRFRTWPQSRVSDDKHHWHLGKHLKSTLHLDSPFLTLSVTRADIGSLKRRKPPVQKLFLQLSPVVVGDEILKSQPSDKTADSIYFCLCWVKNTLAKAMKIRPNSNHTTITRRKTSNNFPGHDSEGAHSSAPLTPVRPDLVSPLMLQTPAVLHLMRASPIRFQLYVIFICYAVFF